MGDADRHASNRTSSTSVSLREATPSRAAHGTHAYAGAGGGTYGSLLITSHAECTFS